MMRHSVVSAIVSVTISAMAACSAPTPEEVFEAAEAAAADSSRTEEGTGLLADFLGQYPQHPLAPRALKHLAHMAQQRNAKMEALSFYERLLLEYSSSEFAPEAQFMVGFISEEDLRDFDRARIAYQRVIDKYPDSDLAQSARHLLPHVGQDPEEWVQFQDSE